MKKALSLFVAAILGMAFNAHAAEVTIDLSAQGYTNQQAVTSTTSGDVTLTYDKGTSSNAPAYYSSGTAVRVYNGGTMTVSCSAGNITQIVLTATANGSATLTASPGTLSDLTWTGSSSSVVFTVGTAKHYRFQKVTVTYEESATVKTPTISGETPFLGSTEVTIACATEGASIYYTTDGTEPTASSTAYTAAFSITETATVKAIAISGSDKSSIAEKTFTAIPTVATVAKLNALENGTTFAFTGNAIVAYYNGMYLYIKDDTGSSLIYGTFSTEFTVGKTITPNWQGSVSIYKNLFEAVPSTTITETEAEAVAVTYPEVEASAVTADNMNQVVTLTGCTYTAASGKNFTITKDGTEIAGYNQFGITIDEPVDGKTYTIVGVISVYNTNVQFQPISITKTPEAVDINLSLEAGADVGAKYDEAAKAITDAGDYVANVTITLAAGEYTTSSSIIAPANLTITGDSSVIDASTLSDPFIQMSTTPAVELVSDYYRVDNVTITNVVVNNVKNSIFYDNNTKYCVVDFKIDNSIFKLATEAVQNEALISFKQGGAKNFAITNSTVYGTGAVAKYFIRYNNSARLDRYGFDKSSDFQTMTYENNTFYKTIMGDNKGQWGNYNGIAGQPYSKFVIKNNIWVDCSQNIIRRLAGGRFGTGAPTEFENNTYRSNDANQDESGYDKSGTALQTDPEFKDAANGDFTIGAGTQQAQKKTGDPRWLVEFSADSITQALDVTITPESGAELSAAVTEAAGGFPVNNLTINTTEGASYTVTNTISAAGNITVAGADSLATIDASGLTGTMFANSLTTATDWPTVTAKFANMKVTGLTQALFASTGKNVLYNVTLDNSVVELGDGAASTFNFAKGGVPTTLTVSNSTVYAPTATKNSFISTQGGQKATECSTETKETFSFQNSTLYNVTYNKNFISHRQNGQTWLSYDLQNCVVINCGKADFISSLNGGQQSTNPTCTIGTNYIGTLTNGTWAELSASQRTVEGAVYATDEPIVASQIDNNDFTLYAGTDAAKYQIGDPRWRVDYDETLSGIQSINAEDANAAVANGKVYNLAGQEVNATVSGRIYIQNGRKFIAK